MSWQLPGYAPTDSTEAECVCVKAEISILNKELGARDTELAAAREQLQAAAAKQLQMQKQLAAVSLTLTLTLMQQ